MAMTVNNLSSMQLLNILNKTSSAQASILEKMATGSKINNGADNPAGLVALTMLESEITAVDAAIDNNQRTDAMLGVADNALSELGNLVDNIQRLANETANDAALTADEVAANQAQIDDALAAIDRIVSGTNFNGKKLIDGSFGIQASASAAGKISDVKVFSRDPAASSVNLNITLVTAATKANVNDIMSTGISAAGAGSFMVQGKDGSAIVEFDNLETVASVAAKVDATTAQTGVYASVQGGRVNLYSTDTGADAYVRTKLIEGGSVKDMSDSGSDAEVTVDGQQAAVDGNHVNFSTNGISLSFDIETMAAGNSVTLQVKEDGDGKSGATFNLGTNGQTRWTVGIDGVYTAQLGSKSVGYLASLGSGGTNSLMNDPNQAATDRRVRPAKQVSTLQGRIGGFQKFQVRTSLNSLSDNKEGLEKAERHPRRRLRGRERRAQPPERPDAVGYVAARVWRTSRLRRSCHCCVSSSDARTTFQVPSGQVLLRQRLAAFIGGRGQRPIRPGDVAPKISDDRYPSRTAF
jgi:flagellin